MQDTDFDLAKFRHEGLDIRMKNKQDRKAKKDPGDDNKGDRKSETNHRDIQTSEPYEKFKLLNHLRNLNFWTIWDIEITEPLLNY